MLERLQRLVMQGVTSAIVARTTAAIQDDFAHALVEVTARIEVREGLQPYVYEDHDKLVQRRKSAAPLVVHSCSNCGHISRADCYQSDEKRISIVESDNYTQVGHGSQTENNGSDFFLTQRTSGAIAERRKQARLLWGRTMKTLKGSLKTK